LVALAPTGPRAELPEPRRITFEAGIDGTPAWSASGAQLVYDSERSGSIGLDLWVIPAQGGAGEQFTSETSNEFSPDWSPNGDLIAYYWSWEGEIYVKPVAGGAATRFVTVPSGASLPAWSPDGKAIAYTAGWDPQGFDLDDDIWVSPYPTGVAAPLTTHPANDFDPTWSPDGSTIAFISDRDGLERLWLMPSSGGDATRLTEGEALQPDWSPDGKWITFSSGGDLWRVRPTGGTPLPLTTGAAIDFYPAWSPSGGQIAFMRRSGDESDLWVVDVGPVASDVESWSRLKRKY
jgi:TolB protein